MGAGATKRGDKLIRQQLEDESDEIVQVRRSYLSWMEGQFARLEKAAEEARSRAEYAEEELRSARMLIDRLRAEKKVLEAQIRDIAIVVEATKNHISVSADRKARWTVSLVKNRLLNAGLIPSSISDADSKRFMLQQKHLSELRNQKLEAILLKELGVSGMSPSQTAESKAQNETESPQCANR